MKTETMGKTLTERRAEYLRVGAGAVYDGLATQGVRGGGNARDIEGWSLTPSAGWTHAAHEAGFRSMNWWHGSAPTPSQAFPEKLVELMRSAPEDLK